MRKSKYFVFVFFIIFIIALHQMIAHPALCFDLTTNE